MKGEVTITAKVVGDAKIATAVRRAHKAAKHSLEWRRSRRLMERWGPDLTAAVEIYERLPASEQSKLSDLTPLQARNKRRAFQKVYAALNRVYREQPADDPIALRGIPSATGVRGAIPGTQPGELHDET